MSLKVDVSNSVELVFNGTSLMGRVFTEKADNKKIKLFSGNWCRISRIQFNLFQFCIHFQKFSLMFHKLLTRFTFEF